MKTFRKLKKGFTIVELVIVIAIIAILAAVLVPTFANLIDKANQSSDTSLVRNLNTILIGEETAGTKPTSMSEVLALEEENGYKVENLQAKAKDYKLVWNPVTNRFYKAKVTDGVPVYETYPELGAPTEAAYTMWTIDSAPSNIFSTYLYRATETEFTGDKAITTGLDVGNETVTAITYENSANQNVVIRTNSASTTLTVKDSSETGKVSHYGTVGYVDLVKVANTSYHEFGKANLVSLTEGRLVIENAEETEVKQVYLATEEKDGKWNTKDNVIIATVGEATLPAIMTRGQVSGTPGEVIVLAEVQTLTTSEQVATDSEKTYIKIIVEKTETTGSETTTTTTTVEFNAFISNNNTTTGETAQNGYTQGQETQGNLVKLESEKTVEGTVADSTVVTEENVTNKDNLITGSTLFAGGSGTEEDPYLITQANQLLNINSSEKLNYKLVNDITLDGSLYREHTMNHWTNTAVRKAVIPYLAANSVFDGNGKKISLSTTGGVYLFGEVNDSVVKNLIVSFDATNSSVCYCSYNAQYESIIVTGRLNWTTGNYAAFTVYCFNDLRMEGCINRATLQAGGDVSKYVSIFVGYGYPSGNTFNFKDCSNEGTLTAGRASMFLGNYAYGNPAIKIVVDNVKNNGIIRTIARDTDCNKFTSIISDKLYAMSVQIGEEIYTNNTTIKWNDVSIQSVLDGVGAFINSEADEALKITRNEDNTFTITPAQATNVAYYVVSVGTYVGLKNNGGSSRFYVEERFDNVSGIFTTSLKYLDFVDALWLENHRDATSDSIAGNQVYTLDGITYYMVDGENYTLNGTNKGPGMINVSIYDSEGNLINAAYLEITK